MSAAAAAETFPEAAFRSHRRTPRTTSTASFLSADGPPPNGNNNNSNKKRGGGRGGASAAILRATGDILIPESLAGHVEFVSGLTELWVPDVPGLGTGKLDGAGAGRFGSFGGMEVGVVRWGGCTHYHACMP